MFLAVSCYNQGVTISLDYPTLRMIEEFFGFIKQSIHVLSIDFRGRD